MVVQAARASLCLGVVALLVSSSGCRTGHGDELKADLSTCGSPLGETILTAANQGKAPLAGPFMTRRNAVLKGPINDGQAIGDALYELVASAKSEVLVQMFDLDETSWLAQRLRDAVARLPPNVNVRVIGNGKIVLETWQQYQQRISTLLQRPSGVYAMWNPGYNPFNVLHFLHNKVIIVDASKAMLLDANIQPNADPEGSSPKALAWHQQALIVGGEVAATLRREYADVWQHGLPKSELPSAPAAAPAADCVPMIVLARDAGVGQDGSANLGYGALLRGARSTLRVITPNLNDDAAMAALADATEQADVHLVLSKGFNQTTEQLGQGGGNDEALERLSQQAKNPCHLHARWFAHTPQVAVEGNGMYASHAKWASADDTAMIIGSQNLDTQSWNQSRELGVVIDDVATTKAFNASFDEIFARSAPAFECGG